MNRIQLKYYLKQISKPVSLVALLIGFVGVLIGAAGLVVMARYGLLLQQLERQAVTQQGTQSVTASGSTVVDGAGEGLGEGLSLAETSSALPVVYQVAPGDSSWNLSEQFYGNGKYYRSIERANNLRSNQWLEVGMELVIPARNETMGSSEAKGGTATYSEEKAADSSLLLENVSSAASGENREKYEIGTGDSLWLIAEAKLGGGEHWPVLYRLNRSSIGVNPHLIYPGRVLVLPEISSGK